MSSVLNAISKESLLIPYKTTKPLEGTCHINQCHGFPDSSQLTFLTDTELPRDEAKSLPTGITKL